MTTLIADYWYFHQLLQYNPNARPAPLLPEAAGFMAFMAASLSGSLCTNGFCSTSLPLKRRPRCFIKMMEQFTSRISKVVTIGPAHKKMTMHLNKWSFWFEMFDTRGGIELYSASNSSIGWIISKLASPLSGRWGLLLHGVTYAAAVGLLASFSKTLTLLSDMTREHGSCSVGKTISDGRRKAARI